MISGNIAYGVGIYVTEAVTRAAIKEKCLISIEYECSSRVCVVLWDIVTIAYGYPTCIKHRAWRPADFMKSHLQGT